MRRYLGLALLSAAVFAAQGCKSCCSNSCSSTGAAYGPCNSCGPRAGIFHPLAPRGAVAAPPPGAVIVQPGAMPGAQAVGVPPAPVPVAPSPDVRNYSPPAEPYAPPTWRPTPDSSSQYAPTTPGQESRQPPLAPGGVDDRAGTPALPVGIPQFTMVKKNVANGLRPTHLEGLEWLKTNGYRMALFIHAPGESDDADRKLFVDKHGMKFASMRLSPESLTLDLVDQFNHIVSDAGNRPLFIYDKDGAFAGALWYLHFRMIDQQSDAEARTNAARLGLKDEHRDMWVAIQKVLSGRPGK